ncbi:hypothetical protein [Nocardia sp. NPDC004860]|uniref:hypothetical protein n=1 Tax=Nocardia sp. NPDC004860 TaxID=3154557 RepID=UPI0033B3A698
MTNSEYPITHFDSAATDSTPAAGPTVSKQLTGSDVKVVSSTYCSNPTIKYSGRDRVVYAPTMYGIQKILATGDAFEPIDFLPYPFSEEALENNVLTDETGIYAITSRRMLELVWTGSRLSNAENDGGWEATTTVARWPFPDDSRKCCGAPTYAAMKTHRLEKKHRALPADG